MELPTYGRLRDRVAMPSLLANNSGSAIDTPHSFPPISGDQSYLGAIRRDPSRRISSPFSIGLAMMLSTNCAYSSGLPSRLGCGTSVPRLSCAACGRPSIIGVRSEEPTSELHVTSAYLVSRILLVQ